MTGHFHISEVIWGLLEGNFGDQNLKTPFIFIWKHIRLIFLKIDQCSYLLDKYSTGTTPVVFACLVWLTYIGVWTSKIVEMFFVYIESNWLFYFLTFHNLVF